MIDIECYLTRKTGLSFFFNHYFANTNTNTNKEEIKEINSRVREWF